MRPSVEGRYQPRSRGTGADSHCNHSQLTCLAKRGECLPGTAVLRLLNSVADVVRRVGLAWRSTIVISEYIPSNTIERLTPAYAATRLPAADTRGGSRNEKSRHQGEDGGELHGEWRVRTR